MSNLTRNYRLQSTLAALALLAAASLPAAEGIANLRTSQRAGTNLVDIYYDLSTTATIPCSSRSPSPPMAAPPTVCPLPTSPAMAASCSTCRNSPPPCSTASRS